MLALTCSFLGGITTATHFKQLPSLSIMSLLGILNIIFLLLPLSKKISHLVKIISAFLLGIIWLSYRAHMIMVPFPEKFIGCPIQVTGTVASIPESKPKSTQFEYIIDSIDNAPCTSLRILVMQYHYGKCNPIPIKIGEQWRFTIRLKKARGFWNVGSFDYEGFLLQKGIQWIGSILESNQSKTRKTKKIIYSPQKIPAHFSYQHIIYDIKALIYQCRKAISANIAHHIKNKSHLGLLNAIVTGFRESISQEQWKVMKVTGTNHLFAISGLHVSFIGGIFYAVVNWLWRYMGRLALYMPAQHAAYFSAWLGVVGYSLLSGFALPVQRATIMATVFTFALLKREVLPTWRGWCIALILILLFEPFVVLSSSFWLSFGTVAIIFYSLGKRVYLPAQRSLLGQWWVRWVQIHWVIAIGLIPLTILFFQQITILGIFANFIAIPLMGFCILPTTLLGSLILFIYPSIGFYLLWIGEQSMHMLWIYLNYIASLPLANHEVVISNFWVFGMTLIGIFIYLSPKGLPGQYYFSVLFLLPLLCCKPAVPAKGEIWLTLLDVGQGLAAIIQTQNHLLVYDTGPRLSPQFDTGQAVIIPYLKHLQRPIIDRLIISHGDNDHSGGAQSILKNMQVKSVLASYPDQLKHSLARSCYAGQTWQWDNVQFSILHPPLQSSFKGNDSSCVLRISNGVHSILLPGDIHRKAENYLMNKHANIKSTVLIAPHHGSKTSSSIRFIQAVQPRYVLFPVGYRNRFHFPHKIVLQRYAHCGSQMYCTSQEGAITVKLGTSSENIEVKQYALSKRPFWQTAP